MYDLKQVYYPKTLSDAVEFLAQNPDALPISGGTDVLIKIRAGRLKDCRLVSLHDLTQLSQVHRTPEGVITVGAGAVFSQLVDSPVVNTYVPVLGLAVDQVGGPQIRNMGTIGGNVCNGAVSADSAPALLTLNARLVLNSIRGERIVPITCFYQGPGKVDREPDEILTEIRIVPADYVGWHGHYTKYAMREAMDIATLGCAANVKLTADKTALEDVRLAYGVAAPTPIRCTRAEASLRGRRIDPALFSTLRAAVEAELSPRTSWRATREFRLYLTGEMGCRTLVQAIQAAGGIIDDTRN